MRLKTLMQEGTYHRAGNVGRDNLYRLLVITDASEQAVSAITERCMITLDVAGIAEIPATRPGRRWEPNR